jgi:hypothetical protein
MRERQLRSHEQIYLLSSLEHHHIPLAFATEHHTTIFYCIQLHTTRFYFDMPTTWSPREVLQLDGEKRCFGWAYSKGRKCNNPINFNNFKRVNSILVDLARQQPRAELLRPKLQQLAEHGLCLRNHQDQIEEMVAEWMGLLREAYPSRVDRPLGRRDEQLQEPSAILAFSRRSNYEAARPAGYSRTDDVASERRAVEPAEADTLREEIRTMLRRLDRLEQASIHSTPSISRVSTSDISSITLSRRSTTSSVSTTRSRRSTNSPPLVHIEDAILPAASSESEAGSTITSARSSRSSTRSSSTSSAITSHRRCAQTHAHRRPVDEECSICYSDILLADSDPSELVWCRSSCGRSVHRSCFDHWRAQYANNPSGRRPLTCTICRAPWADDCGCSGCTAEHVTRRAVEGNCAVCQEQMLVSRRGPNDDPPPPLVWCKDGCGRSVHEDCFETWREECIRGGSAATCVMCRTLWSNSCL